MSGMISAYTRYVSSFAPAAVIKVLRRDGRELYIAALTERLASDGHYEDS